MSLPQPLARPADLRDYGSIVEALRDRATRQGDVVGFVYLQDGERESGRLTYAALDRRARTIAAALQRHGCRGQRVLLVYPQGLDLIEAIFGCLYAGAIGIVAPVVVPQQAFERAPAIARDAQPVAALTLEPFLAGAKAHAELAGLPWIATDQIADDAAAPLPLMPAPEDIALLQYTSGTTSAPRGVIVGHDNLIANLRAIAMLEAAGSGTPMLRVGWTPTYHDMGLVSYVFTPVFVGVASVMMPPLAFMQKPMRWLELVSRYRATYTVAPSFAFSLCVRRSTPEQRRAIDLSAVTIMASGGEPVRVELLARFAEAFADCGFDPKAFCPAYGMAEVVLFATGPGVGAGLGARSFDAVALAKGKSTAPESVERERRIACCGRATPGHELAIVDAERLRRVPDGSVGEIWLRGPSVTRGYWNRPEQTAAVFDALLEGEGRGWLRTGDLGLITAQGVFITGRRKDLIIVRGANHDPLDLELAASQSHPALGGGLGAAFSVDAGDGENVVLAFEVDRNAVATLDASAVTTSVAESLSRRFGLTLHDLALLAPGSLPRTTSGKIQRARCREHYVGNALQRLSDVPHPALGRWRGAARG